MECLHEKPTASSTTQHGTFWFCGQKPSCNFFGPDEDSYMMTKAVESFRKSGNLQPICPAHQKPYGLHLNKFGTSVMAKNLVNYFNTKYA